MTRTSFQQYQLKQCILKTEFGKLYQAWNDPRPGDDRCIFCNLYEMLWDACEAMKGVENNLVRVAFDTQMKKEIETMQKIASRFEEG